MPILARPTPRLARVARWCRRNPLPAGLATLVAALLLVVVFGSLAAAIRLREAARGRLAQARLAEARALRNGDRLGRREAGPALLAQAAETDSSAEVRDEAIASLALFDFEIDRDGPKLSDRLWSLDFDDSLERYAWSDREGNVVVCRVADDLEVCRLPVRLPYAHLLM